METKIYLKNFCYKSLILLTALSLALNSLPVLAGLAGAGFPVAEDFTTTTLRDDLHTTANWSIHLSAARLASNERMFGAFTEADDSSTSTTEARTTTSLTSGDFNGDGMPDIVLGNYDEPSEIILNPQAFSLVLSEASLSASNSTLVPAGGPLSSTQLPGDPGYVTGVAVGDIDRDGWVDIITCAEGQPARFYRNTGLDQDANPIWQASSLGSTTYHSSALALGDLDGDGDLDLVIANTDHPTQIYFNDGDMNPWDSLAPLDLGDEIYPTAALALGDLDGDGDLDLVLANPGQATQIRYNGGAGQTWNPASLLSLILDTRTLALGDVDNDGDLDLLVGIYDDGSDPNALTRLYINDGEGPAFDNGQSRAAFSTPLPIQSLALADIDNDGDLDAMVGLDSSPTKLFLNDGTSLAFNKLSGRSITTNSYSTRSILLLDYYNRGQLDLVEAGYGDLTHVYDNSGDPSPYSLVEGDLIGAEAGDRYALAAGDVDRDGDLDLVEGIYGGQKRLYRGEGDTSPFSTQNATLITNDIRSTLSLALGDLDDDGDLDLAEGVPDRVYLYFNDGDGDPWDAVTAQQLTVVPDTTVAVRIGDIDRDGHLDIVTGNLVGTPKWFRNVNGLGTTWLSKNIDNTAYNTQDLALGDLDRDGDLDVVTINSDQYARLYLNNDDGDSWTGSDLSTTALKANALAVGDVDKDGDLDVLIGTNEGASPEPIRLYLNNGTASGWTEMSLTTNGYQVECLTLADLDLDGDQDLLLSEVDDDILFLLNSGVDNSLQSAVNPFTGVYPRTLYFHTPDTQIILAVPFSSDAYPDLILGRKNLPDIIFTNLSLRQPKNGWVASDLDDTEVQASGLAAADVDKDGDIDFVEARQPGSQDPALWLYQNSGLPQAGAGQNWGTSPISDDSADLVAVALGDLDKDGYPEAVVAESSQVKIYFNNGSVQPFLSAAKASVPNSPTTITGLALADLDNDEDLDIAISTYNVGMYVFQNSLLGSAWTRTAISGAPYAPLTSLALGDVDKDNDIDIVTGASQGPAQLYQNNGSGTVYVRTNITTDSPDTRAVALGDVDSDWDFDLVLGNLDQPSRLIRNRGPVELFSGSAWELSDEALATRSLALTNLDNTGYLELAAGNQNSGPSVHWEGGCLFGCFYNQVISTETIDSRAILAADFDSDGQDELVTGNFGGRTRIYDRQLYATPRGQAVSLTMDATNQTIHRAALTSSGDFPANTHITYWLSSNGGQTWLQAYSGRMVNIPTSARGSDLRWMATLESLSPFQTPQLESLTLTDNNAPTASGIQAQLTPVISDASEQPAASVEDLFTSLFVETDGDLFYGIAVVQNAATSVQGVWQYETIGGEDASLQSGSLAPADSEWIDLPLDASLTSAVLVTSHTRLRFVPAAAYVGQPGGLTVRLGETQAGQLGLASGERLDISSRQGGSGDYSSGEYAVLLITQVLPPLQIFLPFVH